MSTFQNYVAPAILGLCSGALLWIAYQYHKMGRPVKALIDVIFAFALGCVAISLTR